MSASVPALIRPSGTGSLPDPPDYSRLPVAQRSAELLRGTLARCGAGVRGIGWPENPRSRAGALREHFRPGLIAVLETAAWVWGCSPNPGCPILASVPSGRRKTGFEHPMLSVREFRLHKEDVIALGGIGVTTRERTLSDLLHDPDPPSRARWIACRLLASSIDFPAFRSTLLGRRRPGRRIAFERLDRIGGAGPPMAAASAPDSAVSRR